MLVNIIQNTISSFRSALAAAEVITTNLKMWLGFQTSETLGRELAPSSLSVVTDGGNGTITQISENSYSSSSDGTSGVIRPKFDFNTEDGKTYQLVITPSGTITGTVHFDFYDGSSYLFQDYDFTTTKEINFTDNGEVFGAFNGSQVYNITGFTISVKELTQITPDKSGNNNVGELFTGKALEFDGVDDYVDVDGFQMTGTSATFAFWFNSNDTLGRFFDTVKDLSDNRLILSFNNNQISILDDTLSWFNFGSVTTSVWNRCVITIKGTTAKCFVNGVQLGVDKTISTIDLSLNTDAAIGSHVFGTQSYFDGSLSDFQIYDKVWFADDIAYDYANPQNLVTDRDGTSIGLSNLKGYWHLSEGAGSLVYDSSGEGNNGTINGATYEPAQPRIPQLGMMNWSKGSNLFPYSEDFTQWNVSSGGTITPNFALAPNGTQTATKYNIDGQYRIFFYTLNLSTSTEYTFSFYAKNISSTVAAYRVYDATNSTNILVTSYLSELSTTDWSRIDVTFNTTSTGTSYSLYLMSGQGTGDILFWGAQLEESSSASAYRLTDGAVTLNSTVIPNPTIPTQDIFGNAVRDRLNSFNLDGSGYAEVADDTDLDFGTGAFTMECWAKADFENTGSSQNFIFSLGGEYNDADSAGIMISSTQFSCRVSTRNLMADNNYTIGDWYHVCVTRDGSNLCIMYIDAVAQADTETTSASITNTSTKQIGRDTLTTRLYKNLISDVRLYDRALTSDEIENNYNAGLSAHTN